MGYIDTVKGWFVSKAKPTQNQYHTLFDYLRFKDVAIPVAEVQNLTTLLQSKLDVSVYEAGVISLVVTEVPFDGDGSVIVAAGYLFEKCIILPSTDAIVKLGKTPGGEEVMPESGISSNGEVVTIEKYSISAPITYYFTGLPVGSTVVTFIRKIKTV